MAKVRWINIFLLSVGSAFLVLLIYRVGPETILLQLHELGWRLPLVFLPYFGVYLLDTWGWRYTLNGKLPVPYLTLFSIHAAGESLNYLTPLAYLGGEPVKAFLLKRRGIPLDRGLASVVLAKTLMTLAQFVFVLVGIALALQEGEDGLLLDTATGIVTLGAFALVFLLLAQKQGFFTTLLTLIKKLPLRGEWLEGIEESLYPLDRNISTFYTRNRKEVVASFLIYLAGWMVGTLEVYFVLRFLGIPVTLQTAFAVEALTTVVKVFAFFIPAAVGVKEGGIVLIFLAFSLSPETGLTFSLVRRVRELFWAGFGLLVLARAELKGRFQLWLTVR